MKISWKPAQHKNWGFSVKTDSWTNATTQSSRICMGKVLLKAGSISLPIRWVNVGSWNDQFWLGDRTANAVSQQRGTARSMPQPNLWVLSWAISSTNFYRPTIKAPWVNVWNVSVRTAKWESMYEPNSSGRIENQAGFSRLTHMTSWSCVESGAVARCESGTAQSKTQIAQSNRIWN